MTSRTIEVDYLARVEGEGALRIRFENDEVREVELRIFEPPRFFEAFLRGRDYKETPDIVARICGICPVAYQMSAVHAIENALQLTVSERLRALRRLLYCGEWIESHVLHIYMLHAPDFLGYDGAIEMARDHREIVERGLRLKKVGNQILQVLGGREIHPINVCVGGFYKLPTKRALEGLRDALDWARDAALETVRWVSGFEFPDFTRDYEYVALRHDHEYPMNEGRITSSRGLDIEARKYDETFEETHVSYSTALHSRIRARGSYFVGPLARFCLNHDRLSPLAREAARDGGLGPDCTNPFLSIVARGVEVLYACDEALRLIDAYEYEPSAASSVTSEPRPAVGFGCTEAPRGTLYHRYRLGEDGTIEDARIVPPTSQNQAMIEADLRELAGQCVDLADAELQWRCEQAIRNYDPCISCATHFLNLKVERS